MYVNRLVDQVSRVDLKALSDHSFTRLHLHCQSQNSYNVYVPLTIDQKAAQTIYIRYKDISDIALIIL